MILFLLFLISAGPVCSKQIAIDNIHEYINLFPNSQIFLINYRGVDISKNVVNPLILQRHFVDMVTTLFIPYEYPGSSNTKSPENLTMDVLLDYMGMFDNPRLYLGKHIRLKVLIYLEPPSLKEDISFYSQGDQRHTTYLREPESSSGMFKNEFSLQKDTVFYSRVTYYLLVKSFIASNINWDPTYISWTLSLWRFIGPPIENRVYIVLIMNIKSNLAADGIRYLTVVSNYFACFFCIPCSRVILAPMPRLMEIRNFDPHRQFADRYGQPDMMEIDLRMYVPIVDHFKRKSRKILFKQFEQYRRFSPEELSSLVDTYVLSKFVPQNATLLMRYLIMQHAEESFWLPHGKLCGLKFQQWQLRTRITRLAKKHSWEYQTAALMLHNDRLRFVSCHFEEEIWIKTFTKLVDTFDVYTWMAFGVCILFTSHLASHALQSFDRIGKYGEHYIKFKRKRIWEAWSYMVMLALDQGSDFIGGWKSVRSKIFYIPWAIWFLGNEFKSYTITELIVPPPLLAFDTFDKLIDNQFDVYTIPNWMTAESVKTIGKPTRYYLQTGRHEALPVASEFWFHIMAPRGDNWTRLSRADLDKETLVYLNHSELFPTWPKFTFGGWETPEYRYEKLVIPHMLKCKQSAVIVNEYKSNVLLAQLSSLGLPAYLGTNIMHQYSDGYEFKHTIPRKYFVRANRLFEFGIVAGLKKYVDHLLHKLKITEEWRNGAGVDDSGLPNMNTSDIKILTLILASGLLLSGGVLLLEFAKKHRIVKVDDEVQFGNSRIEVHENRQRPVSREGVIYEGSTNVVDANVEFGSVQIRDKTNASGIGTHASNSLEADNDHSGKLLKLRNIEITKHKIGQDTKCDMVAKDIEEILSCD